MSDTNTSITITDQRQPSRQALQADGATKPGRVTGKLLVACKAIVWEGQALDEAASAAGLTTRNVRLALQRPHVIAFLKAEREVFRAYVSAQNIHHAVKMRDTAGNAMAQLGAMKFIEQIEDAQVSAPGRAQLAGVVIQIVNSPAPLTAHERATEAKPLIDNDSGSDV